MPHSEEHQEPVHPATGDPLTPLERQLLRLSLIAHEAENMIRGINRTSVAMGAPIGDVVDDKLMFGILNQAKTLVCKFLEVWEDFPALREDHPAIIDVRIAAAPLVRRMMAWGGLADFRNTTLAHAYLNTKGQLVLPGAQIRTGRVPTYHAEAILLLYLIPLAALVMHSAFEAAFMAVEPLLRQGFDDDAPVGQGITDGEEIFPELGRLSQEVDAKLNERGLSISPILREHFKRTLNREEDGS